MSAKPFNGHPSWNAWNVALWIGNDEALYRLALECMRGRPLALAARRFIQLNGDARTPDGARYSLRSVRLALAGLR